MTRWVHFVSPGAPHSTNSKSSLSPRGEHLAEFLNGTGSAQRIEPMRRLRLHAECGSMFSVEDSPAN
jgi:hypothetical protein